MDAPTPCFLGRAPAAIESVVSETALAQAFILTVHLVACLNLLLIGVLTWTKN